MCRIECARRNPGFVYWIDFIPGNCVCTTWQFFCVSEQCFCRGEAAATERERGMKTRIGLRFLCGLNTGCCVLLVARLIDELDGWTKLVNFLVHMRRKHGRPIILTYLRNSII